jgi:hypothetical protein
MTCSHPLELDALLAYWLGEATTAEAERVEEHVFGCADCTRRLEWLAALADGVRAAVAAGRVGMIASPRFAAAMKEAGLRVREYRLNPGDTVSCTLGAADHAVVAHVRAPLAGVRRLDAVLRLEVGGVEHPELRIADVPFDEAASELLFVPRAAPLRTMPAHTLRVRLVAVGEAGDAALGDYTFAHTPSA